MSELLNSNFIWGMVLAKELPDDQKTNFALQASQMPANNVVGLALMKKQVDNVQQLDADKKSLKDKNEKLNVKIKTLKDQSDIIASLTAEIAGLQQTIVTKDLNIEELNQQKGALQNRIDIMGTKFSQYVETIKGAVQQTVGNYALPPEINKLLSEKKLVKKLKDSLKSDIETPLLSAINKDPMETASVSRIASSA